MTDQRKTKAQLIAEVESLRRRVAELEQRERQTDATIGQAVQQWSFAMDACADVVYLLDNERHLVRGNVAFYDLMGVGPEEVVGRHIVDLVHPEGEPTPCQVCVAQEEKRDLSIVMESDAPNNPAGRPIEVTVKIVRAEDGSPLGILMNLHDLTIARGTETALRESEERYRNLTEAARDVIFIVDPEDNIAFINSFGAGLLGQTAGEVMGNPRSSLFPPDVAEGQRVALQHVFKSGEPVQRESRAVFGGRDVWLSTQLVPLKSEAGEVEGVLGIARDITERRQAAEGLRESDAKWQSLTLSSPDHIMLLDLDYNIDFINHTVPELTPEDVIGKPCLDFVPPGQHESAVACFESVITSGRPHRYETHYVRVEGMNQYFDVRVAPLMGEDGNVVGLVSSSNDVTERKQAEEALRASNRALTVLSECNEALVRATDESDLLSTTCRILVEVGGYRLAWVGFAEQDDEKTVRPVEQKGYDREYLAGLDITWADTKRGRGPTGTAIREGRTVVARNIDADPNFASWREAAVERGYASSIALPLMDGERAFGALNVYSVQLDAFDSEEETLLIELADDVAFGVMSLRARDERRNAENALRESEDRYRGFVKNFPGIAYQGDLEFLPVFFHGAVAEITGYSETDLVAGRPRWDQIIHPDDLSGLQEEVARARSTPGWVGTFEYRIIRKDGDVRWVLENNRNFCDEGGAPIGVRGTIHDITERRRTVEALRETEERATAVLEAIPDSVFRLDRQGIYLDYMAEDSQLYARSENTIIGKKSRDILPAEFADLVDEKTQAVLRSGVMQTFEYQLEMPDRGLVNYEARMVKSGEDEVTAFVRDVTERNALEAEKFELEKQLRHSQRLETAGTLAGGIAHDFNNILTPIMGYAEVAQERFPPSDPGYSELEGVLTAARRAKELVERILLFSRHIEKERTPVKVQSIAAEAIKLLRSSIPSTIAINERIDSACGYVMADDTQLHQVIVNLCTNAFQAMEEKGGTLSITVEQVKVGAEEAGSRPQLTAGDYVRLSVGDTGLGMDEDTVERVFEPFFTTRSLDKGTGMGLAVVYGIVSSHEGDIVVTSAPGEGALFEVYLPAVDFETETTREEPVEAKGGGESILVVDDDVAVADVLTTILERLGYRPTVFTSSTDALAEFQDRPDGFDLVISDLTMPGLTGLQLSDRIKRVRPGIPILILTGYGEMQMHAESDSHPDTGFLAKPIAKGKLAAAIREALDD